MAKEPFIDKVIRFLEKLAWHFGIPPSEDSSLVNGNNKNTKNKKSKVKKTNNSNNDSKVREKKDINDNENINQKGNRTNNSSKSSKKVVNNSNITDKMDLEDIDSDEEVSNKSNFQSTGIDELLNNDVSLREIATVKELQSLDINHMNLPGFVSKDLKPFNKDLLTLENFEILLINMMVEKKEEYILKYKGNPLSDEEITGIFFFT